MKSQGQINADLIRLFNDKSALKKYAGNLTEKQREIGKSHLDTHVAIRKNKNNAI